MSRSFAADSSLQVCNSDCKLPRLLCCLLTRSLTFIRRTIFRTQVFATNDVTQFLKSLNTCKTTVSIDFLGFAGLKCIFDQDQEAFRLPALGSSLANSTGPSTALFLFHTIIDYRELKKSVKNAERPEHSLFAQSK